jgi:hypothetical protein
MNERHLGRIPTKMEMGRFRDEKLIKTAIWVATFSTALMGLTRYLETHPEIMEIIKKLPSTVK